MMTAPAMRLLPTTIEAMSEVCAARPSSTPVRQVTYSPMVTPTAV
jgi:hypothetical protein